MTGETFILLFNQQSKTQGYSVYITKTKNVTNHHKWESKRSTFLVLLPENKKWGDTNNCSLDLYWLGHCLINWLIILALFQQSEHWSVLHRECYSNFDSVIMPTPHHHIYLLCIFQCYFHNVQQSCHTYIIHNMIRNPHTLNFKSFRTENCKTLIEIKYFSKSKMHYLSTHILKNAHLLLSLICLYLVFSLDFRPAVSSVSFQIDGRASQWHGRFKLSLELPSSVFSLPVTALAIVTSRAPFQNRGSTSVLHSQAGNKLL